MSVTASHSSTIAEECIKLLRLLHRLPAWNKKINEFICLKMSLLNEIISEIAGLHRNMTLLDICCGSGAIGLSLASKVGNVSRDFLFFLSNLD